MNNKLNDVKNIEQLFIDRLKQIQAIDELYKESDQDDISQILKLLVAKTSGDFTLMFRISQLSPYSDQAKVTQKDQVLIRDESWIYKCKIGLIDYDAKYSYQIKQWVVDREQAIKTLSKQLN